MNLRGLPVVFMLILAGCQTSDPDPTGSGSLFEGAFGDMQPRVAGDNPGYGDLTGPQSRGSGGTLIQNYRPDSPSASRGLTMATPESGKDGGSYTLNFENADIKDVVRAILNDALKVNYVISGNVAGPVTLSSTRPVSRNELLVTLERSLDSLGYALNREGETYRISPSASSSVVVDTGTRTRLGYGVSVVPLRYVKAATMLELLSGFVAQGENLKVDASKNTIFIRGSGAERQAAVAAVVSFDDDWMQDQSVSVFTLQEARPDAIIPELQRIFGDSGDDAAIQFRSIDRLRGILAISRNPRLIARAATWVRRLDQQTSGVGEGVFVYKPKHRSAEDLAAVLSGLFGGGGSRKTGRSSRQPVSTSGSSRPAALSGDSPNAETSSSRVSSAFDATTGVGGDSGDETAPGVVDLTTQPRSGGGTGGGIRISADASNNSVVTYADADAYKMVLVALRQLDSTPQQVAVNVTIAEVQLTDNLKYGVQYYVNSHGIGFNNSNNQSISLKDVASSVVQSQIPGFNFLLGTNADPDVIISALSVISNVEILSSPSLVVVENQTATLQVGDQVPVTTRQAQSVENGLAPLVNQVEFRDTGIILNVTPRIGQNDAVTMNVEQEISAVVNGSNTLTPTISKRRVASQISVQNGQTVLLAGLISAQQRKGNSGVPGTRNIPVLGKLLGQTDSGANRTELIMLIRPVVVRSSQDAASVAAELKSQMWGIGTQTPVYK